MHRQPEMKKILMIKNKHNFSGNHEILFAVYFDYITVECCLWSSNDTFGKGIHTRVSTRFHNESCEDTRNEIISN